MCTEFKRVRKSVYVCVCMRVCGWKQEVVILEKRCWWWRGDWERLPVQDDI